MQVSNVMIEWYQINGYVGMLVTCGVVGERPPGECRLGGNPRPEIPIELIPLEGLAIRLGSLHTEVGGATRAMSGRLVGG